MNKKEKMKKLLGLMGPDNSWMQDNENSVKVSQAYQKIDPSIKKLQPKQPTKLQRAIIDLLEAGHNPNEASKIAGCTSTYVHETKRQVEGGAFDAQNHLGEH